MKKRGELSSGQIVTIVLAIAGFIIILIFLSILFDDGGESDRELCRLSVLARATSPLNSLQASVPLKCATEKICVSESGRKDSCRQFLGEDNVRMIKLKGNDLEKARIIEKEAAESMYFCWSMMGQGKLNIFKGSERDVVSKAIFSDILNIEERGYPTCVVCSRFAIAEDIPKSTLDLVDVNRYLEEEVIPFPGASETYLQAFTDRQVRSFPSSFYEMASIGKDGDRLDSAKQNNQIAFVFMQILASESVVDSVVKTLGTNALLAGGAAITTKGASVSNPWVIGAQGLGIAIAGTVSGVNAYETRQLAASYCGSFTGESQTSGGCSLIAPVDYKVSNVNSLCHFIEGSP